MSPKAAKPRLLVVSHVLPFPGRSGQQQRVRYTLEAAMHSFHVTFVTVATARQRAGIKEGMGDLCDSLVLLPSRYSATAWSHVWHRAAGAAYALATGLKLSNYLIGKVELEPSRLVRLLERQAYDCALFEYWHAADAASALRRYGVPCVLDMHNVLWQSFDMQMGSRPLPAALRRRLVSRYREHEEAAWRKFDAVVAINADELRYVRDTLPDDVHAFFAPMGIDLSMWPYSWEPVSPPRVAFYGSLASPHNQRHAALCASEVMPRVWARHPQAELWIVGSRPPERIQALASEPRITVTGFVENVRPLLATMSAVVCPWEGRYGFRSRLVELMALGVPVVASADAVAGMDLRDGDELLLRESADELASGVMELLEDERLARAISSRARGEVESRFNNEDTYGRLARELCGWLEVRNHGGRAAAAAV